MTGLSSAYACAGDTLSLSCPGGRAIRVVRANYGRFSIALCNDEARTDLKVNCRVPHTIGIMRKR